MYNPATLPSEEARVLTNVSLVTDPDVDKITISYQLKPGKKSSDLDSLALERALLTHISHSVVTWARYCRDTGLKTLGVNPDPVYKSEV